MMPRKKRITLIIVIAVIIILILIATLLTLYIKTDMLKSKKTLFLKYMGANIDNIDNIEKILQRSEYDKFLEENKYTSDTQIKVNYTEQVGTSSENTNNDINKLKINIKGQTDEKNSYDYKDIQLLNNDETALEVEYLKENNTYSIKFLNLIKQYILVENTDLKELFKKVGYSDEEIEKIPDEIKYENSEFENKLKFTQEEKKDIKEKYSKIISNEISNYTFSSNSNVGITIDGKKVDTNSYSVTMNREQLNNLFIKILEALKKDETILSKFEGINEIVNSCGLSGIIDGNIKDKFISSIDEKINQINQNNIGNEETKITVYQNRKKTVKTIIQREDCEIDLDFLNTQEENYINLSINEQEKNRSITYTLKKDNTDETKLSIEEKEGEDIKNFSALKNEKTSNQNGKRNIVIKFEDVSNKIETSIEQSINVVNDFDSKKELKDDKSVIKLNDLDKEKLQKTVSAISTVLTKKMDKIYETINKNDIIKALNVLGILKEEQNIEVTGMSEAEKNRFNSRFEFTRGEKINKEGLLRIIEESKDNIIGIEIASNTEIKLKLDVNKNNEKAVDKITAFVEKNDGNNYNVDIEYDEITGLASYIVLKIIED